jgi:hypothetical protein
LKEKKRGFNGCRKPQIGRFRGFGCFEPQIKRGVLRAAVNPKSADLGISAAMDPKKKLED